MPLYVHRTTFQVLPSTSPASLAQPIGNYVQDPDLSLVIGFASRYWSLAGDIFSVVDQATRDSIDAALLVAARDSLSDEIDRNETFLKAFALVLLDELNAHSAKTNAILDAIDGANNLSSLKSSIGAIANLPIRMPSQLKSAVRSKLNG